jgi:hypothetical protein
MLEILLSIINVLSNIYYCHFAKFLYLRIPTVVTEPYFAKFGQNLASNLKFETFGTLPDPRGSYVPNLVQIGQGV